MNYFQIASCMADNATVTCRDIAEYVGHKIGLPTRFVEGISWQEREALLDQGRIHLCWICGLPYAWKASTANSQVELCVVPVMSGIRYKKCPVYFSDIVVHRQSSHRSFADLQGASWAYNEPRSHSGYNIVRHHLAKLGRRDGYFGSVIESGSHQRSLKMITNREIDVSAIDSTVLEAELRHFPQLNDEIRIVGTLGPSPMPPWVILKGIARDLKDAISAVLLDMHTQAYGRQILGRWGISHFALPNHGEYQSLLQMEQEAKRVRLACN